MDRRALVRSFLPLVAGASALQRAGASADNHAPGQMPMARGNPARTGEHPGPGPSATPVVLWRFAVNSLIRSSPAIAYGHVFFGSDSGFLYGIDIRSGAATWSVKLGDRLRRTPAVHGGHVFIANGPLNVIDAATGTQIAKIAHDSFRFASSLVPIETPAVGTVVFGAGARGTSGFIEARLPVDGPPLWRLQVVNHVTTAPTIVGDTVYAGTLSGELFALDAATGDRRWGFATAGGVLTAPAVAGGAVYATAWAPAPGQQGAVVPNATGILYAVDAETGRLLWQAVTGSPVESGPAVAGGLVAVGGDDSVFAFDSATGSPRWRVETGGPVRSSPAIVDRIVYVGSGDHHLYALDLDSGDPIWTVNVGAPLDTGPAVVDGVVYATCGNALVAVGDA